MSFVHKIFIRNQINVIMYIIRNHIMMERKSMRLKMKNKKDGNNKTCDKLAIGLIVGFLFGLIFNNIALGLFAGIVIGSLASQTK